MERSKHKLKRQIENEITKMFTGSLSYAEVALEGAERWKHLRARILKLANDAIRDIHKELDDHYDVSYKAPGVDVIVVNNSK